MGRLNHSIGRSTGAGECHSQVHMLLPLSCVWGPLSPEEKGILISMSWAMRDKNSKL